MPSCTSPHCRCAGGSALQIFVSQNSIILNLSQIHIISCVANLVENSCLYLFSTMNEHILINSMEQSPSWEANKFSASQKIPCILWTTKVHYRIHKSPPPVPILSQINPVYAPHPISWRSIFNAFCPFTPGSSKWSLSLMFPHQNPVFTWPHPFFCYAPHPSHSCWFDGPNNIWWGVHLMKLLDHIFLESFNT